MSATNSGYSKSTMRSRAENSNARSYGIQTPLRYIVPIFTTCRTFSLFRIPSRRPRVMPATFRSLVPLIMLLSSLRATQIPRASTWKHKVPSSSHRVVVTRGLIPGGGVWPRDVLVTAIAFTMLGNWAAAFIGIALDMPPEDKPRSRC